MKYYLRGLGLGILVTAIVMGLAASRRKTMTDEQIIARAKQLGMIEDTVLAASSSEEENTSNEDEPENTVQDDQNQETDHDGSLEVPDDDAETKTIPDTGTGDTDTEDAAIEDVSSENDNPTDDTSGDDSQQPDEEQENAEAEEAETMENGNRSNVPIIITIGRGDGSYTVSKKLEEAGAISSASDFDNYLCKNGYDKRIRSGTHTIPPDASDEQLARIITGME